MVIVPTSSFHPVAVSFAGKRRMMGNARRILVVDDDGDILDLLKYNLEKEGFQVKTLDKSHKTLQVANKFLPDLIILDLMMPQVNGTDLCSMLRSTEKFCNTYIFFLTARSGVYFQQNAIASGGDDYIEKVMGLRSLMYKVNSVLKSKFVIRKRIPVLQAGNITIDRSRQQVLFRGDAIHLNNDEFELLFFFVQNSGKVITLENIVRNIWGSETYVPGTSVDLCIQNLRQKFGTDVISSVQKDQYRLEPV